jgi:hypothetical protein
VRLNVVEVFNRRILEISGNYWRALVFGVFMCCIRRQIAVPEECEATLNV